MTKLTKCGKIHIMKATDGKKTANANVPMSVEMREQIELIADDREWSIAQTTRKLIELGLTVQTFTKSEAA